MCVCTGIDDETAYKSVLGDLVAIVDETEVRELITNLHILLALHRCIAAYDKLAQSCQWIHWSSAAASHGLC